MTAPKVSVIIPLYNCEDYIIETMESVFNQTLKDFEVIVVDDGSTDRSSKILLERYKDVITYIRQTNSGISSARNKGIAAARGKFIAFLDHDDRWLPGKLEKQISLFERDDSLGLVYSDSYIINGHLPSGNTLFSVERPKKGYIYDDLLRKNFIPIITVVVKRTVLDDAGLFDSNFSIAEDWDLLLRIARKYKMDYVDEPLAEYRIHQNSFSKNRMLMFQEAIAALDKNSSKTNGSTAERVKKSKAIYEYALGFEHLKKHSIDQAKDCFRRSIRNRPAGIKVYIGLAATFVPAFLMIPIMRVFAGRSMHE